MNPVKIVFAIILLWCVSSALYDFATIALTFTTQETSGWISSIVLKLLLALMAGILTFQKDVTGL